MAHGRRPGEQARRDPPPAARGERVGWYFYDFANSAFSTTVVTVFLGPYLTSLARAAADPGGFVHPFGLKVAAGAFFPYAVSVSVLLQVLVLPVLGAVADYAHRKKQMLFVFAYLGSFSTMAMYGLSGSDYLAGGALFVVANLAFGASIVFYNAFLPEIAAPAERDRVSSIGWALGYLGGGLLLALNLLLLSGAGRLGLSTGHAVRISLGSAGAWWALFSLVPLATLRSRQGVRALPPGERYLTVGFRQLRTTLGKARRYPRTLLFLAAALLYNDGIQTVIAMSAQFGQEELGLSVSVLTAAILMVQFIAFFGSLLFGRIASWIGTRRAIMLSLTIWLGTLVYAYGFLRTATHFFVLAAVTAVVLGGSQALTRSAFSLMIPKGEEAEYFGLFEVSQRGTSWLGPLLFGVALQFTGSYRVAIVSLALFFLAGLLLLSRVDIRQAALDAGNEPPARG